MGIDAALRRPPNCDVTFDGSSRQNPSVLQGILMPQSLRSSAHFIPRHRFEPAADPYFGGGSVMNEAVLNKLERRLGRLHAKLRLGIEMDHEAQIFGQGINFFHIENIATWWGIPRSVSGHLSFPSALIVFRKLRCITSNAQHE